MELLLNICCLLLLVPAVYLWRHRTHACRWRLAVALACLFFLLLPVISATDDLHAVSQEIEESTVRKSAKGGGPRHTSTGSLAILPNSSPPASRSPEPSGRVGLTPTPILLEVYAISSPSRAPPS